MAGENKGGRKVALVIFSVIIIAAFVIHYVLKGTCTGADPAHDYFIMSFAPQVGNAGIVFTVLWWFGGPVIAKMITDRKATVEKDIEASRRVKSEAEKLSAEVEQKVSRLDSEKKNITVSYWEAAKTDCERIAQEAEQTAERLRKDAEVSFELQANVARQAFEAEVMHKAIERAREEITRRLENDKALRDKLIDQSIASLEI